MTAREQLEYLDDFLMRFFNEDTPGWTYYSDYTDDGHTTAHIYNLPKFSSIQELRMKLGLGMEVTLTSEIVKL